MRRKNFCMKFFGLSFAFMLMVTLSFPLTAESTSSPPPDPYKDCKPGPNRQFPLTTKLDGLAVKTNGESYKAVVSFKYKTFNGTWSSWLDAGSTGEIQGKEVSNNQYVSLKKVIRPTIKGCVTGVKADIQFQKFGGTYVSGGAPASNFSRSTSEAYWVDNSQYGKTSFTNCTLNIIYVYPPSSGATAFRTAFICGYH